MASHIERRKLLATLGGAAAAWPLAARAQQAAMPTVGLVTNRSADASARHASAFRKGLNENRLRRGAERDGRVPLAGRPVQSLAVAHG